MNELLEKLRKAPEQEVPTMHLILASNIPEKDVATLGNALETMSKSQVMLRRLKPIYSSPDALQNRISCRKSGCRETTPRLATSSHKAKQDLFLCPCHRNKLMEAISKRCNEFQIFVSYPVQYKRNDLKKSNMLIHPLEQAFSYHKNKWSLFFNKDRVLAEVFLNVRNFLLLINALLSPNDDNLKVALPPVLTILDCILDHMGDTKRLEKLSYLLREVMNIILDYFQIIYDWITLGNPGAQIGAGVGLLGGAGFAASLGLGGGGIFLIGFCGLISGKLVGGGTYELWKYNQGQVNRFAALVHLSTTRQHPDIK